MLMSSASIQIIPLVIAILAGLAVFVAIMVAGLGARKRAIRDREQRTSSER
jgi:hypothetical protein